MLVAPVEERGRLRLMYRSTLGGGVYDATVANGVVRAVLRSKATVEVAPRGDGTLTWAVRRRRAGADRAAEERRGRRRAARSGARAVVEREPDRRPVRVRPLHTMAAMRRDHDVVARTHDARLALALEP